MLRVHRQRFAGGNAEKRRIEVGDTVDEPAGTRIRLVGCVGVGIEQTGQVPAAVRGELRHHVAAVGDHLPQGLRGVNPAGEAARHPDDRDRLARPLQQRAVGPLQAFNLDQRFPQRFGCMLELINHY